MILMIGANEEHLGAGQPLNVTPALRMIFLLFLQIIVRITSLPKIIDRKENKYLGFT